MTVKDKDLGKEVDVSCRECPTYSCYWPRLHPGVFVQGQGYHHLGGALGKEWICGTREIRGCPENPKPKEEGT